MTQHVGRAQLSDCTGFSVNRLVPAGSLLMFVLLLSACASLGKPDLQRLYANSHIAADQPPVILIPGIMGSRLADDRGREQWVGSIGKLLTSSFSSLTLPVPGQPQPANPPLHPTRLTDKSAGRDFYASIERVLGEVGGYQRAVPGVAVPSAQRSYYEFAYDWRQDNVINARKLGELIDQIRIDYDNPDLQVDIIAHSMGGLIARYYLRYGVEDVLDSNDFPINYAGAGRVRRLALLGTPNLGSVSSLHAFLHGQRVGLGKMPTEELSTFASIYQLFPHPLNDWIMTSSGKLLDRDLFDVEVWRRFQWSVFDPEVKARVLRKFADTDHGITYYRALLDNFEWRLGRARRFVWSLTVPLKKKPWDIRVFGGDCTLTPTRIVVEESHGDSAVRLRPTEIREPVPGVDYEALMLEPGDGKVSKASLLARQSLNPAIPRHPYSFFLVNGEMFLCEKHDSLSTNINFQDNLLNYLLSRDSEH